MGDASDNLREKTLARRRPDRIAASLDPPHPGVAARSARAQRSQHFFSN
jgi:hypothetical protein